MHILERQKYGNMCGMQVTVDIIEIVHFPMKSKFANDVCCLDAAGYLESQFVIQQ